jgi:hypothetical protein
LGFIASAFGIGTLGGGLAAMRVRPKYPMRFATIIVFFFAGVESSLALRAPIYVMVMAAFVCGFAGRIFAVIWYTTQQVKIPAELLSRVSAYDHLGSRSGAPWHGRRRPAV